MQAHRKHLLRLVLNLMGELSISKYACGETPDLPVVTDRMCLVAGKRHW